MNLRPVFSGLSLLAGIFVFSLSSYAQEESQGSIEDERYVNWYQIELIVFERANGSGLYDEHWPKTLTLEYPDALDFLFSETQWSDFVLANEHAHSEQSERDPSQGDLAENREGLSTAADRIEAQNTTGAQINLLSNTPEQPEESAEVSGQNSQANSLHETAPDTPPLPEMAQARILLKPEEHTLRAESSSLSRRSAYKVLFHEAWRQPLLSSDQSKAIPIAGGERFDAHHELEGWIKISLNRFLHFETALWHTDYELNYGQESEYWPEIPAFPTPKVDILVAEKSVNTERPMETSADISFDAYLSQPDTEFTVNEGSYSTPIPLQSYGAIEKTPYIVKQIVTLSQKRRMRSEELHYIDHPSLGILIKLIPYSVYLPAPNTYETNASDL